jgi:transposase InsO family protein
VTVYRWVLRFTPLLADAARPCRHVVGDRWQVDETYVRVAGRWRYVYRAIDQFGQVVDVFVSTRRDADARGVPEVDRLSYCAFVFVDEAAEDVMAVELPRCG